MKFGIRDVVDVVFRAKGTMDLGNKRFYKNEPVLYFDTLTASTLEGASNTVYATGGSGNARLMAWESERTVTFTMTDALLSAESMAILTGAGLVEASNEKPIYTHVTEVIGEGDYTVEGAGDGAVLTVNVDKEPFLPVPAKGGVENENYACVFITRDGEVISEPYIVSQLEADGGVAYDESTGTYATATPNDEGTYTLRIKSHECNFGKELDCHDDSDGTYHVANLEEDHARGNGLLIDYYTPIRSGAKKISVDAEHFGGSFYIEGSTLVRDTNGVDHPAELIIPNAKVQSNFSFSMSGSGKLDCLAI